mmetsp:Transcript_5392/g.13230  ORF Transcript_5392/g.13230 Transcript_5392/m.13230 type:complete len:272 (-) Transcript_5392:162-977(-)
MVYSSLDLPAVGESWENFFRRALEIRAARAKSDGAAAAAAAASLRSRSADVLCERECERTTGKVSVFAPCRSRQRTTSRCPACTAASRGVFPCVSDRSRLARSWQRRSAASAWPWKQLSCSGVECSALTAFHPSSIRSSSTLSDSIRPYRAARWMGREPSRVFLAVGSAFRSSSSRTHRSPSRENAAQCSGVDPAQSSHAASSFASVSGVPMRERSCSTSCAFPRVHASASDVIFSRPKGRTTSLDSHITPSWSKVNSSYEAECFWSDLRD